MRTQGPSEEISTYLLKVRDLLDQLKPPLTLGEQLDRVYQKFHPSYRLHIERKDFENFPELQRLGKREELRRAQEKTYKPPPPIADSQGDDQGCGSWIWLKLQEVFLYDK